MFRELAYLLQAGFNLFAALDYLVDNLKQSYKYRGLVKLIVKWQQELSLGKPVGKAFAKAFCANRFREHGYLVSLAEKTGKIADIFNFIAEQLTKQQQFKARISKMLLYPCFIFVLLLILVVYIFWYWLPNMSIFLQQHNLAINTLDRLLEVSQWLYKYMWYICFICLSSSAGIYFAYRKRGRVTYVLQWFILRLPILGGLCNKLQALKISFILKEAYLAGIPLLDALFCAKQASGFLSYQMKLTKTITCLEQGMSLSSALNKLEFLPTNLIRLIAVGEKTGKLSESLETFYTITLREVDIRLSWLTGLLEPILLLCIALLLVGVIKVIYQPIFALSALL